ncbi:uncharacterized protein FOMMEDRAFT_137223 [Fomitiporia mediterranea MF3/22]|uniref:uncharacterized protein n=1 Tax=Fomitiporia mediterranea (strain MF3/22) TaxID=694068 RepID=UPI0004409B0B|nr:uncharacterized protein FOMMEDRAFT_137223 [Fomitiporia mediterranea MF3/22]EJC97822.1 hypothetical protein FOMMEDRAFT_137223 [Fomitiporia mediterranea MF3/22]
MSRGGKPLDLPGLYWDDEKKRYFPIASRPKRKTTDEGPRETPYKVSDDNRRQTEGHRSAATATYPRALRIGTKGYSQRARITQELEGKSLVASYTELDPPVRPLSWQTCQISSFHAATVDDTLNVLVGDSRGVFHCSRAVIKSLLRINAGPDRFNDNSRLFTSYHLGSGTPVSHITRSGNIAVAVTSTCDSCFLGVRDLNASDYSGVLFPRLNVAGDIRAADLLNKSLALGMSRKLVWIKDVSGPIKGHRTLQTKSDILSIAQSSNTITAGLRNGEVRLFDVRTRGDASTELFGSRFSRKIDTSPPSLPGTKPKGTHSAITRLQTVGDWEMLVATSAGELEMFDLRFATGNRVQPIIKYDGHVNSYLLDLGITIDPTSSFLFAEGQDRRIRAWVLQTGEQLGVLLGGAQLARPARALAVTQTANETRGARWLWIPQEEEIRVVRLGGPIR